MDTSTMLLALALGNLTLCAVLFFFQYDQRKSAALTVWAQARQLQGAGWVLLFIHGFQVLPPALALLGGYGLLFTGLAFEAGALWQEAGAPRWRRVLLPVLAGAGLAYAATYVTEAGGVRVVVGALVMGLLYGAASAALACRWSEATMLRRFLAVAGAVLALAVALRGVLVLAIPEAWTALAGAVTQLVSYGAFYVLMLLNGFGYLLLERERHQDELARLAVVDTMLDVSNRRGFFNALAPWMSLARRPGQPTALMVFDVDQFKRLNDAYGHPAGDAVLRVIVDTCKKQLRDSDHIGRLVGVEFAVLLPRTGAAEALVVAERVRSAIEATPIKTGRALVNMTVSVAVSVVRPDDSTVSLFKRLDDALRRAKREGRNRVVEAEPPLPVDA
jgi:diguanylate cyclase (GGDEF)-like protein